MGVTVFAEASLMRLERLYEPLDGGFIEVKLAHVKEKRQPERYANQKTGDYRKPEASHTEATAFGENENPQHERRNDDIEAEEASDAVCKQLIKEKREIQSVVQKPRQELPGTVGALQQRIKPNKCIAAVAKKTQPS